MRRNASKARNIADIAREAPNYASKSTFEHVHILLSPSDGGAWRLDNDVSSLINEANPEKVLMSCHNWVIVTKHLHLNESIIGLYNMDSGEHTTLPHIVTELEILISASNSNTFDACNMTMREEIVFVTLSFPSNRLYTMRTANNDDSIHESMNMISKPGGINAPTNTEDCEILHAHGTLVRHASS
ncbi:hypothetical protein PCE1_002783 [Barthelona sp. PCE]